MSSNKEDFKIMVLIKKTRSLLIIISLLLGWWGTATLVNKDFLPSPFLVLKSFTKEVFLEVGGHFLISARRILLAIVLSFFLATPLGLILAQKKQLDNLISPLVYFLYPIPKIVFLPIIFFFLGIGDLAKVFIISLILFWQLVIIIRDGSKNIRIETVYSVYSLGATPQQILKHVYLPFCLPNILTALRINVGTAIAVLFFTESFATNSGLGYFIIVRTWGRMTYPEMYIGIISMGLLGLMIYKIIELLESYLCRWIHLSQKETAQIFERQ